MKIKILVATHQPLAIIESDIFHPIQIGFDVQKPLIKNTYLNDNSGLNISKKNPIFNELTALYWAWKNLDADVVGLAHYRRYLDLNYKKPLFKNKQMHVLQRADQKDKKIIELFNNSQSRKRITNFLKAFELIIPQKAFCTDENGNLESLSQQYKRFHIENDWIICIQIILEKYPDYKISIDKYFENENILYLCNMFIAPKKWVDKYCTWLFDILFEVENRITISEDPYQKRVIGFLAERLFTLYILHNKFKMKELPILFVNK
jgi:hypothetical protein